MRRPIRPFRASLGLLLASLAAGLSGLSEPVVAQAPEPSSVKSVQLFASATGRARWSPKGDRIAFDRRGDNGFSELWIADANMRDERCISCPLYEFKKRHIGNPAWHPSGDFLVVQVHKPVKVSGDPMRFLEVPGGNLSSDLYFIRSDGRDFWNLTNLGELGGRAQSPVFSHEGDRLAWAERVTSGSGVFGRWALRVAKLEIKTNIPRLKKIQTFKPGEQKLFLDVHGFTTDDRGLIFSGNPDPGQPESGMDIYSFEMESGKIKALTHTTAELDRFALAAPNGNWIVWSTSRDIGSGEVNLERRQVTAIRPGDLWMMNAEGLSVERLTRFNDVHSPQYAGRVQAIPTGWNREGDKLLALVLPFNSNASGDLYVIEFNEPIGR